MTKNKTGLSFLWLSAVAFILDLLTKYIVVQRFDLYESVNILPLQQQGTSELTATILKEDLVRIEGLPLVTRATGIPFDALPKSQVLLKITELDPEKQFIALNYVKAVAPAVA